MTGAQKTAGVLGFAAVIAVTAAAVSYFGAHINPSDLPGASSSVAVPVPPTRPVPAPTRERLSVIDEIDLGDGLRLREIYVPGYPLGRDCLVLTGPQGTSISCGTALKVPSKAGTP